MNYNFLEQLVTNENKNIEIYKKEILKLKEEMSKISDQEEIKSYQNSINCLEYIIVEKEKLLKDIKSGDIFH